MKQLLLTLSLALVLPIFSGCITSEGYETTQRSDFHALWTLIDEHYCFFDYKHEQYGLDWDAVRRKYEVQIHDSLSQKQLFEILSRMVAELRDGHVNLSMAHNSSRFTAWYENSRANFYDTLERKYLGKSEEYRVSSLLRYRTLRDNIGYVRCSSFDGAIGEGNLHEVMSYLAPCDGLIVDVRSNLGGRLTSASTLASAFTNERIVTGYISHKTGPRHNDFSALKPITLSPAAGLRWQKPVVVLCNRRTYSAANSFVMQMSVLPQVIVMGDTTGGGSGMPFSAELPSGMSVRFSASPIFDIDRRHTEFGIAPDERVDISLDDYQRGIDTIIERAIDRLRQLANS